jgi:hypothetical protein
MAYLAKTINGLSGILGYLGETTFLLVASFNFLLQGTVSSNRWSRTSDMAQR